MMGLKIFGWICLGLAPVFFLIAQIVDETRYWEYAPFCWVSALVFLLMSVLTLLVIRALREIRESLELKMLMNS